MVEGSFKINRAPVLTLWATIVAERIGFDHDEALTLGRAVAGLNAYSKGKRLGIFKPSHDELRKKRSEAPAASFDVELMHRAVPVVVTPEGVRALSKGKPTSPKSVEKYLESKFGEHLAATERVMADLAMSFPPGKLAEIAFELYEDFRPEVPAGVEGWGAAGTLDLARIRATGTTTGVR
jgi:hypothetical protein